MQRLASTVVHSEMVPVLLKVVAGDLDVILGVDDRLKETAVQLLKVSRRDEYALDAYPSYNISAAA